jgi:predicted dehydrogenase
MDYDTVRHRDGSVQQSMWISMETESGANAVIRGAAAGVSHAGHQFLIQGDAGTLRGRVDSTDGEELEWDDGGCRKPITLQGEWFPDGFLASMCELLEAIHSGRLPVHSLSDNLRTVALVAAVCASAQAGGRRVDPRSPAGWPSRA